jgi:ATP-dependent DNA helicase RecG
MYVESETLELKRELTDDSLKTIVAFANTKGGTIIYGVNDDSSLVGTLPIDLVLPRLTNMIRDSIVPDITRFVSYNQKQIDSTIILEVRVSRGTQRPYALKHKG